jgi:predicted phage terminase large subunit-like protein
MLRRTIFWSYIINIQRNIIRPQAGAQEYFLTSGADIIVFGGSAGGGKTFAQLLDPIRYKDIEGYNATFFRRTNPQITAPGGLWNEAQKMYRPLGASFVEKPRMTVRFPKSEIIFANLQHEKNVNSWQGSQLCAIFFDELTHFSKETFFYFMSRNRSVCGVKPYIRATCNPDPNSWLAEFMEWFIDQDTGYPIAERSGKIRYFFRDGEKIIWAGRKRDLRKYIHLTQDDISAGIKKDDLIKSFTFISSSIYDNRELLKQNPSYLASLKALPTVEREQLLNGNWKIKRLQGDYFRREWFKVVDQLPSPNRIVKAVRGWDRASTEKTENNDPDFTAGCYILKTIDDEYIIADARRFRERPARRNEYIVNTAQQDKSYFENSKQVLEQDPGQAGVEECDNLIKLLTNNEILADKIRPSKNKVTRALPLSAACENGLVSVLYGDWNDDFFLELEQFSENSKEYKHDDIVDGCSCAFNYINNGKNSYNLSALSSI